MRSILVPLVTALACAGAASASTPWAVQVVSYNPGATAVPGYTDPASALGAPSRFTGTSAGFPGVVSMFNPAFETDQIVSIGEGGHLTLRLDRPALNDLSNPFGVDLIIFGNAGFIDVAYPGGVIGPGAGMFGLGQGVLELSVDGVSFVPWGAFTEGLFPTVGYLDAAPFQTTPGAVPSDLLRPVNPALTRSSFAGLTHAQALTLYAGSGGGTPIDIGLAGLASARYLRLSVPDDGSPGTDLSIEIDAVAVVPAPAPALVLGVLASLGVRRRR